MIKKNPEIFDGHCWHCGKNIQDNQPVHRSNYKNKKFCNRECFKLFYKDQREKIIQLRTQQRLSLKEFSIETGAAKGNVSLILKDFPLSKEEINNRHSFFPKNSIHHRNISSKKYQIAPSTKQYDSATKGHISELAVLLKLEQLGYAIYLPLLNGQIFDSLVVDKVTKKIAKIQVKTLRILKYGMPHLSLKKNDGRKNYKSYQKGDFDFIIGYDLDKNDFYIYKFEEIEKYIANIAVQEDARNRWDKIQAFLA